MCLALATGALIILGSMWQAKKAETAAETALALDKSYG
jgi:hypothetical protein